MFQFRRFPSYAYLIQRRMTGYCPAGLPHSEIPGSMDICSSPRLIAACHVLRRLLMPRHSPCALSSLTLSPLSQRLVREFLVLFENYAGFQRLKLYVTLHPFGCCSTINLLVMRFRMTPLCCLTCFVTLFSFQGAEFQPLLQSDLKIRPSSQVFKSKGKSPGGPEWARTTDLTIISRTL